ncbi:MAG TPA: SRPBCC family protein, partial [Chryseosolibacter sp.]|nr:SRPBCC family protein [Chryseosolibacter sp.]
MVDVTTDIIIHAPAGEVAAFACDPDRAPEWYENIKSVRWETPKPIQPGSRILFTAQFLGKELNYTYEVRQLD